MRASAEQLVGRLREVTSEGTVFRRRGDGTEGEELPTTAASFIEALVAAFESGGSDELLGPIRAAADWFIGANSLGVSLYDFGSGGCNDALSATGLNRNQGTEATALCVLALLTLTGMANVEAPAGVVQAEERASRPG